MRIRWLRNAVLDLVMVRNYIAGDNPQVAKDVAKHIISIVEHLRDTLLWGDMGE